jgi:hypothetical protein
MKGRIYLIGIEGGRATDSQTTRRQIEEVKRLECALEADGERLTWEVFDNPAEPRSLFRAIEADRKRRIDERTLMADRPLFAVVTAWGRRAVRLEFYEGHDALELVYDLRAPELAGLELPAFLESDLNAYDPIAFLGALGFPRGFTGPLLKEAHKESEEER